MENQTRDIVVPAVRGEILDDEGRQLVMNQTSLVVSVDMMQLSQQDDGGTAVLHRLARLLGMSYNVLKAKTTLCTRGVKQPCWTGSPYQPIPVDEKVSNQDALEVMEEPTLYAGVTAQVQPVVYYPSPDGANPAQVLGYLQPITQQEISNVTLWSPASPALTWWARRAWRRSTTRSCAACRAPRPWP